MIQLNVRVVIVMKEHHIATALVKNTLTLKKQDQEHPQTLTTHVESLRAKYSREERGKYDKKV